MRPSILWTLLALTDQTNQHVASIDTNLTTPNLSDLGFILRRGQVSTATKSKRTVSILKKTRNENYRYFIDFNMGNPPQHIAAELNLRYRGMYVVTGSTPFSIVDYVISLWRVRTRDGVLTPSRSSSYKVLTNFITTQSDFYGTSRAALAQDDFYIGITVLENANFVVLRQAKEPSMIGLGLSPTSSDYVSEEIEKEESTNIFNQMKDRGWTLKSAFSIWIGSEGSDSAGMVLFNSANYQYALSNVYIFPLLSVKNKKGYYLKLSGINNVNPDGSITEIVKLSMPIELNFEMVYSTLPRDIVMAFYPNYGVSIGQSYKIDCEQEKARGSIGLVFSGVQFIFRYVDVLPDCQRGDKTGNPPFYPAQVASLGANFLSVLYMVFDLDEGEVGLAIANTNVVTPFRSIELILDKMSGTSARLYSDSRIENTYSFVGSFGGPRTLTANSWE